MAHRGRIKVVGSFISSIPHKAYVGLLSRLFLLLCGCWHRDNASSIKMNLCHKSRTRWQRAFLPIVSLVPSWKNWKTHKNASSHLRRSANSRSLILHLFRIYSPSTDLTLMCFCHLPKPRKAQIGELSPSDLHLRRPKDLSCHLGCMTVTASWLFNFQFHEFHETC